MKPSKLSIRHTIVAIFIMTTCACERQSEIAPIGGRACALGDVEGVASRVLDGDTIKLRSVSQGEVLVRLDQIDAPENRQPWSNRSKQMLTRLLGREMLCVTGHDRDRYGRLVGEIHVGRTNINYEMVRQGGAWAYRQYLRDSSLVALEQAARAKKAGLWSMPEEEITAPWEFRKARREASAAKAASAALAADLSTQSSSGALSCEAKPKCRQMTSCNEAMNWLRQCGGEGIDGDRDGIPCERVCRPRLP